MLGNRHMLINKSKISSGNEAEGSENLRVLVVDLSLRYGGASTRAISIAKYFSSTGGKLAVIENSAVMKVALEQQIPIQIVGKRRTDPLIPFRIARIIQNEKIQVVDTQNIQSKFWVSLAVLFSKIAFVSTLNSLYNQEFGESWKSKVYYWIDRLTNIKVDKYVVVSNVIEKSLIETKIDPEKIHLIRNAVSLQNPKTDFDRSKVRKRFNIPESAITFTLLGRMVWAKGIDDFILAFSSVYKDNRNTCAVIIGDGELRTEIEKQVIELGLQNQIYLLGYQPSAQVMDILRSTDVFVMPSRSEGIPFALLEAAAIGIPIIATYCGGIPEVVTNEENALLVPIGDVEALSKAMMLLCSNKQLADKLGSVARERIARDYSLNTQMERLKEVYLQAYRNRFGFDDYPL